MDEKEYFKGTMFEDYDNDVAKIAAIKYIMYNGRCNLSQAAQELDDLIKKIKENDPYRPRLDTSTFLTHYDAPEMVDLGLPSGLKWAKWNVGATKETEDGKLFAWGDTVGSEATSEGCSGKYTEDWYAEQGLTAITSDLTLEQDAANVAYGGNYRMPTKAEIKELRDNTKYSTTTIDGVKGGKFTAKNGNYIFFPFAGCGDNGSLSLQGNEAYVWSSSCYGNYYAWFLGCVDEDYEVYGDLRYCGYSVRAVAD